MKKLLSVLLTLFLVVSVKTVLADQAPPAFPSCSDQTEDGDYAHYDYGIHQIVGNGLVEGRDDVYSLGNDNYLQCYCPVEDSEEQNGIQTNWWYVNGVSQDIINNYLGLGWLFEASGTQWNLASGPYLAKNIAFNCGEPEPTPTPTGEPQPTPTPIDDPDDCNAEARCAPPPGPPICTDAQPEAPILLSVVKSGNDGVDLTWTEAKEAQYYLISYGLESGNPIYGVPNVGKVQAYHIGGLDLNNKYYFTVRAHRGCAPSDVSNELSYPQVQGRVLGLAATGGMDFDLLKWLVCALIGVAVVGTSGFILKKGIN